MRGRVFDGVCECVCERTCVRVKVSQDVCMRGCVRGCVGTNDAIRFSGQFVFIPCRDIHGPLH